MSVQPCPHCQSSIPAGLEACPRCGKLITPGVANLNTKKLIPVFVLAALVLVAIFLYVVVFKR